MSLNQLINQLNLSSVSTIPITLCVCVCVCVCVCDSMSMYSICLLSCRVGVQTFLSTIKALCASQSLPCVSVIRGRGRGYSLSIKHPLAKVPSVKAVLMKSRTHCGAFQSFLRMSTGLKYELPMRREGQARKEPQIADVSQPSERH